MEQHDALFDAFDSLTYREREVVRAHLGFCDKCHTTQGEKNRPQTFYEIAIDHELSSAEAAENIYKKALQKMKDKFKATPHSSDGAIAPSGFSSDNTKGAVKKVSHK